MIQTKKHITTVTFGNNGNATIAVGGKKNTLTLQQLLSAKEIGSGLEDGEQQELPKIVMEFFDTKSIDVVIKILQGIKENMTPTDWASFALAC